MGTTKGDLESVLSSCRLVAENLLSHLPLYSWGRLSRVSKAIRNSVAVHSRCLKTVTKADLFPVWLTGSGPVEMKHADEAMEWLCLFAPQISNIVSKSTYWSLGAWPGPTAIAKFDNLRTLVLLLEHESIPDVIQAIQLNIDAVEELGIVMGSLRKCFYFNENCAEVFEDGLAEFTRSASKLKSISILARRAILNDDSFVYFHRFVKVILALPSDRGIINEFCMDLTDESPLPEFLVLEITGFLQECSKLSDLSLYPLVPEFLEPISVQLTSLETGYCKWEELFEVLPKCPNITKLHLFFAEGPNATATVKTVGVYCKVLQQLVLINCFEITREAFAAIGEIGSLKFLRIEDAYDHHDMKTLSSLRNLEGVSIGYDAESSNICLSDIRQLKSLILSISENKDVEFDLSPEVQKTLQTVQLLSYCKEVNLIKLNDGLLAHAINLTALHMDGRHVVAFAADIENLPKLQFLKINETSPEEDETRVFSSSLCDLSSKSNSVHFAPSTLFQKLRTLVGRHEHLSKIELVKQNFADYWLEETLDFEQELIHHRWTYRIVQLFITKKF